MPPTAPRVSQLPNRHPKMSKKGLENTRRDLNRLKEYIDSGYMKPNDQFEAEAYYAHAEPVLRRAEESFRKRQKERERKQQEKYTSKL